MRKIRIVSNDGIANHVYVVDSETGEPIDNVTRIEISPIDCETSIIEATITFAFCNLDMIATEID